MTEEEAVNLIENEKRNGAPEHLRAATLSAAPKLEIGYASFTKHVKTKEGE
ncbi:hypothetical protein [Methanosarcina barkeri]|uniref:Uncharacterized protein n=1 Tax=Methanosarcina barkeri CM1 TaxID=796385 RepID=A0A0G3CGJ2_METBA|nr:hypothetical protein [Methanosarcina barkeri]AKJ39860.1 hypothetical protein MCM1_2864 [Methanosarcina barkeri CM1]